MYAADIALDEVILLSPMDESRLTQIGLTALLGAWMKDNQPTTAAAAAARDGTVVYDIMFLWSVAYTLANWL